MTQPRPWSELGWGMPPRKGGNAVNAEGVKELGLAGQAQGSA